MTFPFSQLHDYAKSIGVSPLSVLAPLMMKAFDDKFGGTDKPVIAEIPVDLRPLLPTLTTRYLFALSICRIFRSTAICRMTRCSGARRRF